MSAIWVFDHLENKHTLYPGKGCMKKFCESLRKHLKNIIDFEKKKMLPLTKEEVNSHQNAKISYICGKRILEKLSKSISYQKAINHCHFTGKYRCEKHSICNLKFNVHSEISVNFYNCSNYDYHFIIKELAKQLE